MISTYLDSNVLMTAAVHSDSALRKLAAQAMGDPERRFVSSPFLEIELLPKASYYGNSDERNLYLTYFSEAKAVTNLSRIFELGWKEAVKHGMKAMDAFHVAAAHIGGCDELITMERSTKPMFRTELVRERSLSEISL